MMDAPIVFRAVKIVKSNFLIPQRVTLTISHVKQSIVFDNGDYNAEVYNVQSVSSFITRYQNTIRIKFRGSENFAIVVHRQFLKLLANLVDLERTCSHPCLFIPGVNGRDYGKMSKSLVDVIPKPIDLRVNRNGSPSQPDQSFYQGPTPSPDYSSPYVDTTDTANTDTD